MSHVIIQGDCVESLRTLPDASVHCCVTSPPYWGLRDYGHAGQIGLEDTPEAYVARMVEVFREVRRVLRDDGTLWLNLGDSYSGSGPSGASYQSATTRRRHDGDGVDGAFRISKTLAARGLTYAEKKPTPPPGLKPKDLVGIPWRVAFALQADGWWLRQDIIWHKPAPMPESVTDRCTKAHEYLFLLTKSQSYFYDHLAIAEPAGLWDGHDDRPQGGFSGKNGGKAFRAIRQTKNKRSVWTVATRPYKGAHFATMPPDLVKPCILAGTSEHGCCSACGAPLERLTKRTKLRRDRPNAYTKRQGDDGTGNSCANDVAGVAVETTGWAPTCKCGINAVAS